MRLFGIIDLLRSRGATLNKRPKGALDAPNLKQVRTPRSLGAYSTKIFQPRTATEFELFERLRPFGELIELFDAPASTSAATEFTGKLVIQRGHEANKFDSAKYELTRLLQIGDPFPERRIYVGGMRNFSIKNGSGAHLPRIVSFYTKDAIIRSTDNNSETT